MIIIVDMNMKEKDEIIKGSLLTILEFGILCLIGYFLYLSNKPKIYVCEMQGNKEVCILYNFLGK